MKCDIFDIESRTRHANPTFVSVIYKKNETSETVINPEVTPSKLLTQQPTIYT